MNFQLSCGHVFSMPSTDENREGWPEPRMQCQMCHYMRDVRAIDVRCWHVKCSQACRFGRWFGSSQGDAILAANKHLHACEVDLMVYPDYRDYVKKMYPGKVKLFIDASYGDSFTTYVYAPKKDESEVPF